MPMSELVGRNIQRFRDERAISIAELARRAGVSKQTVSSLEGGEGNPTVDTLDRIGDALGVSVRALLTEMGYDTIQDRALDAVWRDIGGVRVRQLDQAFGSGYVTNTVLRIDANRGVSHHKAQGRGSLRHCFVIEGRVNLGPNGSLTLASEGDFVRFPAEVDHSFEAITPIATMFVVTTAPQLTMAHEGTVF